MESILTLESVGLGSSPIKLEQKENLLKAINMKKQCKMGLKIGRQIVRLLVSDAHTNPTIAPIGESPMAQSKKLDIFN